MSEKATAVKSAGAEPSAKHSEGIVRNLIIQPKLTIGSPNDHYEQQADQVASRVMRIPMHNDISAGGAFSIQRKCVACAHEEEQVQRKPFEITPFIQKSSSDGGGVANDAVSSQIESARGGGSPMGTSTRRFMESRFGNDFSAVKIHTDSNAIQLTQNLNAQAFTVGNDVFFNEGKYNPESDSGKHLLAHELVHTVQQKRYGSNHVQRVTEADWEEGLTGFSQNEFVQFCSAVLKPSEKSLDFKNKSIISREAFLLGIIVREGKKRKCLPEIEKVISGLTFRQVLILLNVIEQSVESPTSYVAEYIDEIDFVFKKLYVVHDRHVDRLKRQIADLEKQKRELQARKDELEKRREIMAAEAKVKIVELIPQLAFVKFKPQIDEILLNATDEEIMDLYIKLLDYRVAQLDNIQYKEGLPIADGAVLGTAGGVVLADGPLPVGEAIALTIIAGAGLASLAGAKTTEITLRNSRLGYDQGLELQAYLDKSIKLRISPAPKTTDPDLGTKVEKTFDPVPITDKPKPEDKTKKKMYPILWPVALGPPTQMTFVKTKSPERDFDDDNQAALKSKRAREKDDPDFTSKDYHIHHMTPLFLGGADKLQSPSKGGNGAIIRSYVHIAGHKDLRKQPQMLTPPYPLPPLSEDIYQHPIGTQYFLKYYKENPPPTGSDSTN